jgi:hypothetical protein
MDHVGDRLAEHQRQLYADRSGARYGHSDLHVAAAAR